jgi:hypothetical protein
MRQRILRLPADCTPQLSGLTDVHEIRMVLEGAARSVLEELMDLPSRVTDPDWLKRIGDENGDTQGSPAPQAKEKARKR